MYAKHNFAPRILIGCLTAAITLLASAPLTRADDEPKAEQNYAKLQRDLVAAYQAKDYEKALDLAEKCHKIKPKEVDTIYNIACLHCLLEHKDKAYTWLEKAIEAGYDDADHLAGDADFQAIKGEKRFRALVKQLREGDEADDDDDEAETKPDDEKADDDADDGDDEDEAGDEDEKDDADEEEDDDNSPQAAGAKINTITQEMMKASNHKKYDEALELAEKALAIAEKADVPQLKSLTNYNVACMHSLLKDKDKSFKHLEAAIELGGFGQGNLVQQIEDDADFDNIRKDPRYKKLLAKAGGKKSGEGRSGRRSQGRQSPFKWEVHVPENLNSSKPAPLIVALHGYNANLEDAMETWKEAADKVGAILLVPQGTMKLEGDHYHWGRDLDTIEENVMDAIDKVMDKHKIAKDKVALVGFSQGAWASWNLATRNPDTFCGLIPVAGNFEPESESIFDDEQLKKLRIFIMVGQDDQENVVSGNKTLAKKFEKLGASVKIKVYDGVAHAFPDDATDEQTKALKFVLGT
jgi:predicted esterase